MLPHSEKNGKTNNLKYFISEKKQPTGLIRIGKHWLRGKMAFILIIYLLKVWYSVDENGCTADWRNIFAMSLND